MRYKKILMFMLVSSFLVGCSEDKPVTEIVQKEERSNNSKHEVKQVVVKDAPKNSNSPSGAVLHQFEVEFKDGEKKLPDKNSIISESILGNNSVVIIRSPEGENKFAVFLYEYKDQWGVNGLLRTGYIKDQLFTDKEGLDIPLKQFNYLGLKLSDKNQIWTYNDKTRIVNITKYPRFSFDEPSKTKTITLENQNEAYISYDNNNNPFLFYYDSENIILLSGTLTENQLLNLANSLPSINSTNFPSNEE